MGVPQGIVVARLQALLPPVGLAWMPEGVLVATTDGAYVRWLVEGDSAGWEERIQGGFASGALALDLVDRWRETANGVTWGIDVAESPLPPGLSPDDVFEAEVLMMRIERAEIAAELEAAGV